MERVEIKNILEALFFITDRPMKLQKIKEILNEHDIDGLSGIIEEIRQDYKNRNGALQLNEIAGGFQLATRPEYGEWVRKLYKDRITYRLTKSSLETLSIIAYKQPVTRSEIEEIRGVDVSGMLEKLLERKLIRICGRKEVIGRPILYGTTPDFLKFFGLKDLSEIPNLDELAAEAEEELNDVTDDLSDQELDKNLDESDVTASRKTAQAAADNTQETLVENKEIIES
ncbi:MAG: SMC-Scp complex subunit ScpB [bacterium]